MKLGRTYQMAVQGHNSKHRISFPTTMKFDVTRHNLSGLNEGTFSVYNLAPSTRQDLFYDMTPHIAPISVQAGYASQPGLATIFNGMLQESYPQREGNVNVVMHMRGIDGLWGTTNDQIPANPPGFGAGALLSARVKALMNYLPTVAPGQVVLAPGDDAKTTAPESPSGSAWSYLQSLVPAGGSVFIDGGKVHFLSQNSTLSAVPGIQTIMDETGIINIPMKYGYRTTLQMVFEPGFVVGQAVGVVSSLAPWVNRPYPGYKIISVHHEGTISGTVSEDAITTLELLATNAPVPPLDVTSAAGPGATEAIA